MNTEYGNLPTNLAKGTITNAAYTFVLLLKRRGTFYSLLNTYTVELTASSDRPDKKRRYRAIIIRAICTMETQ